MPLSHIAVANHQSGIDLLLCELPENIEDSTNVSLRPETAPKTLPLVDEWDEVSGLAFAYASKEVFLHASGFLSGCFGFRIETDHGANGGDPELHGPYRSALTYQASTLQKDFDQHHDLGGLSYTKTWGLASWGPYVGACITMHPGDMIEYSIISEQRCHVLFSHAKSSNGLEDDAIFPWQDLSRTMPQDTSPAVLEKILIEVSDIAVPHSAAGTKTPYNICCAAMVCSGTYKWHLVEKILRDLSLLDGINLGPELNLLEEISASQVTVLERIEQLNVIASARAEAEDPSILHGLYEFCSICDQMILWQSSQEAQCISGHHFARCGLTFLPIMEPGISKHCEVCFREFLDESRFPPIVGGESVEQDEHTAADVQLGNGSHAAIDTNTEVQYDQQLPADNRELRRLASNLGLVEALSNHFDVCPYCHGKYTN
ncbi:MAG: hypothetical protein Q9171_004526 [Xanthocarpia ochracea]